MLAAGSQPGFLTNLQSVYMAASPGAHCAHEMGARA